MPSARASLDLAGTVALALVGLLVALLPADAWIRAIFLLPMVLALPGYAAAAAMFPPGTLPSAERAVYVVALSVALTTLCGVIVQLVLSLERSVWAVALFSVIAAASWIAVERRERGGAVWTPPRAVHRLDPRSVVVVALAVAITGWSISISSEGARKARDEVDFSELWVLPREPADEPGARRTVSIGVKNHEGSPISYRVRVTHAGKRLAAWRIRLADGRRWQASLPAPQISPSDPLEVELLRGGQVDRRAYLREEDLAS